MPLTLPRAAPARKLVVAEEARVRPTPETPNEKEQHMRRKAVVLIALALPIAGCDPAMSTVSEDARPEIASPSLAQARFEGLTRKAVPTEDPGPPFYARVTTILNQFFHADDWLAIPFYRDPSCVPPDFNLLELFDFPGADGPGAFACPLLMSGFLLIEPDAPLGTFPRQVVLRGDAVPFRFVPWSEFEAGAEDGVVTMAELSAMNPVAGIAHRYHETLKPREGDHLIVIRADGTLEDGRSFRFGVSHLQERTRSIHLSFR